MFQRETRYAPHEAAETSETLLSEACGDFHGSDSSHVSCRLGMLKRERRLRILLYMGTGFIFISLLALSRALFLQPSEIHCAKVVSPFSPLWEAVEFWEGDLTNYFNHSSIYRGPPSLERELAWNNLWHHPAIGIDDAGIKALNKTNHGKHIEIVGSDPNNPTYGSMVEVFHQLHCLNLIRQATWPLHLFDKSWGDLYPWDLEHRLGGRMHVDHCIEALRLSLMCYADITPVLMEYDESSPVGRVADFSVHHKCRNFDKLVDFVKEHGVSIPSEDQ